MPSVNDVRIGLLGLGTVGAGVVKILQTRRAMLEERTGKKLEQLAKSVKALVVTLGARGSLIMTNGRRHEIPSVQAQAVVDPTGCGDAYRAGLLYGIAAGLDWPVTGRIASLLGALKIARRGAQNHQFTRDEIASRYKESFGSSPW